MDFEPWPQVSSSGLYTTCRLGTKLMAFYTSAAIKNLILVFRVLQSPDSGWSTGSKGGAWRQEAVPVTEERNLGL